MEDVVVQKYNEVYIRVLCDKGIAKELSDYLCFTVPGAHFMPTVKDKIWDGKIRLYNVYTCELYKGLITKLYKFCQQRNYKLSIPEDLLVADEVSLNEIKDYPFSKKMTPYDDQVDAIAYAARNNRAFIISPTASGKSFIAYCIIKYFMEQKNVKRTLVVIDGKSLIRQLQTDFQDYAEGMELPEIHAIMEGATTKTDAPIVIATWQSIYKLGKKWFDQFDMVIGDEAHMFKAKCLTTIMEKLTRCTYRFGMTGTIDEEESQVHSLVIQGLFGPKVQFVTTKELMDSGRLSQLNIKAILLKYPEDVVKEATTRKYKDINGKTKSRKVSYQEEIEFLVNNVQRNTFIKNLALSQKGNMLVLFRFIKHGKILYDMIADAAHDKQKVYYIFGKTDVETREEIRRIVQGEEDAIIIASFGTFQKGINIPRLHNVILASPYRSKITVLQSIGRSLRKASGKSGAILLDIADDLSRGAWKNHTLKHYYRRIKLYIEENFDYKIYNVKLRIKDNGRDK